MFFAAQIIFLVIGSAFFLLSMFQRKTYDKRLSSIVAGGISFVAYGAVTYLIRQEHPHSYLFPVFAMYILTMLISRKLIFIYELSCPGCHRRYPLFSVFREPVLVCPDCGYENKEAAPKRVSDINWKTWKPKEEAVLCFVKKGDDVLLIHKKTGLGAGKINGPGGRIEAGETARDAAIRELQEEVCITVKDPVEVGTLHFVFRDGYSLKAFVFIATEFSGSIKETVEADPFWCKISEIPYEKMWADDELWLSRVLSGEKFQGFFIFEGDKMLNYLVDFSV